MFAAVSAGVPSLSSWSIIHRTIQYLCFGRRRMGAVGITPCVHSSDADRSGKPCILGCRLSLETDYREFWEFDYPAELKVSLMAALLQSRSVLAWMRYLTTAGIQLEKIQVIPRSDAQAAVEAIGGMRA